MATKTGRFAVRLTAEQDALIRRAAEVEGTDLTNFTVTATPRSFYSHFEFESSPTDPFHLLLSINDARDSM